MGMWGEALLIGKGSDPVTQECSAVEHYVKKVTIIWVCCCRYFPSLVFPPQKSSFSICYKAGLVVLRSLSFCLSVVF